MAKGLPETSNSVWRRMKREFRRDPEGFDVALAHVHLTKVDFMSRVRRMSPDQAKQILARARKAGQTDAADKLELVFKAAGKLEKK